MGTFFNELYLIFRLILIVTLPIFITFNVTRKSTFKFFALFIASIIITIIFVTMYFLDTFVIGTNIRFKVYLYLMIISGVYFIVFTILFILNIKKIKYRTRIKPKKQKMVYTYHEKREYLYYFFTLNDDLLLLDEVLTGIKLRLKPSEFSDEVMDKILNEAKVDTFAMAHRKGSLTVKGDKIDDVYYCYMIELDRSIDNYRIGDNLVKISKMDFLSKDINRTDKYIIIKSISSDHFDDTL